MKYLIIKPFNLLNTSPLTKTKTYVKNLLTSNFKWKSKLRNSNFKHSMKRLQIPRKIVDEKFYVHEKIYAHEIAAVYLSQIYFLKSAKKTCKLNNRDLNRDWISMKCFWF